MKIEIFLLLIVISTCISNCYSICFFGSKKKCPTSPIISSFKTDLYSGKWYEIQRFDVIYEFGLDCVTATYGFIDSTSVSVLNKGSYFANGRFSISINGTAKATNSAEPNKLTVSFPIQFKSQTLLNLAGKYDVWSTDYTNYALVYSCTETKPIFNFFGTQCITENAWILSRNTTLDSAKITELKSILTTAGVDTKKFKNTAQTCS